MRVAMSVNLLVNNETLQHSFDMFIKDSPSATSEVLAEIEKAARKQLALTESDTVEMKHIDVVQKGFSHYFDKMIRDLNNSRNHKPKGKTSITRYNLFFLKEPEINLLNDDERFMAYMDIIERKAQKEQFTQVGTYIREARALRPDDLTLIKYQSRFFLDSNQNEDAVKCLEQYVQLQPDDTDMLIELAKLCDTLKDTQRADKYYDQIIQNDHQNLDALVRRAQMNYYQQGDYLSDLDALRDIDADWLKDYLKKHWDYHLPEQKTDLNPIRAAYYLGFDKALDIVGFAFRKEIPAYTDWRESKVLFSKTEIDQWFQIINRYDLNEHYFELYPDALEPS